MVERNVGQEIKMQRKVLMVLVDLFMTGKQKGSRQKGKTGIGHPSRGHWRGVPQVLGKCP